MSEAAGGEGPEQLRQVVRFVSLQVGVEVLEAGALAGLGVVTRQRVVEQRAPLRAEPLAHHDLDEPSEAADALQEFFAIAPVDDEGVHALSRHAGGEHPPAARARAMSAYSPSGSIT